VTVIENRIPGQTENKKNGQIDTEQERNVSENSPLIQAPASFLTYRRHAAAGAVGLSKRCC
jgi:hypothetical protein